MKFKVGDKIRILTEKEIEKIGLSQWKGTTKIGYITDVSTDGIHFTLIGNECIPAVPESSCRHWWAKLDYIELLNVKEFVGEVEFSIDV